MKCKLENRENLISRYLLNELSDEESLKFEEHYFKCEECFNELKAAEDALNLIKNEGFAVKKTESDKSFIDKIFSGFVNPVRIGIAIASIAVIFVLLYVFSNLSSNKTEPIIADDGRDSVKQIVEQKPIQPEDETIPKQKEDELLSSLTGPAFEPNAYYEEWINENVRSVNQIVDKVFSPVNSDTLIASTITFNWRMKENLPITLVILNNKEEEVFSSIINQEQFPDYRFVVNANSKFKSGLYYWKIEDENEVHFVGKFYFIKSQ